MSSIPDVLGRGPRDQRRLEPLAVAVARAEDDVALTEVTRWRDLRKARIDIEARAALIEFALGLDLAVYDKGMELAENDPVKEELALRYVQDQNLGNRATVNRAFER